jgi:hypothetical protein
VTRPRYQREFQKILIHEALHFNAATETWLAPGHTRSCRYMRVAALGHIVCTFCSVTKTDMRDVVREDVAQMGCEVGFYCLSMKSRR